MNRSLAVVLLSLSSGLAACQGVFNVDFDKAHLDGGASSSGGGKSGGGGTTVPDPPTEGTVAGTWDITGSIPGEKAENGTLKIGPNSFRIEIGGAAFDFSAGDSETQVTYTRDGWTRPFGVEHRQAAVSWGILPISKGGSLTFTDPTGHTQPCVLELGAPNSSFECQSKVGGWPAVLPKPVAGSRYEMTRISAQVSSFGDLGGHWQANVGGGTPTCTIDFVGDKITASCPSGLYQIGGKLDATFGASVVSGHLSGGVEFAGQKR